jgi:hypothetical protein
MTRNLRKQLENGEEDIIGLSREENFQIWDMSFQNARPYLQLCRMYT